MEQWPDILVKFIEDIVVEVEFFLTELDQASETFAKDVFNAFEDFSDQVIDRIDELSHQLEDNILINFEEYYPEVFSEQDLDINLNNYPPLELNPKIPAHINHLACIDCVNYHGRIYGDNLLVCAMHPFGWEEENCPDWESNN